MEYFNRAKVVRLRSQHQKYLAASEDEEGIRQSRSGSSKSSRWFVESVDGKPNRIRLKSCYSRKYLSASDEPFLLGWTGKRVLQTSPRLRLDPGVEWEPIQDGSQVKLMSCHGNFLRGNGGVPPWNNSVTHDQPSRTSTQDWVLWVVDVLEGDYQHKDDSNNEEKINVVEDSLGNANTNISNNNNNVDDHDGLFTPLSRHSSASDGSAMEEDVKEYYEVDSPVVVSPKSPVVVSPKSVRSVRSNKSFKVSATPSSKASPKALGKSTGVSPHSTSFNKLKSMLNGLQDLLDEKEEILNTHADVESETAAELISEQPHQLEVKMAKQTLKGLKNMDFESVLSSGRDTKLEKSINILIADAKASYNGRIPKELTNLRNQLKSMRKDRELAYQYLNDCTDFSNKRIEVKAELKKDAAKAHELETLEDGLSNMLVTARAKREDILKQLEEVECNIKAAEKSQADIAEDIEELITRIEEKSKSVREMEKSEKSWQARKIEAEGTLESVEEEWDRAKSKLQEV